MLYILGGLVSWPIIAGMFFSHTQAVYSDQGRAQKNARHDLGNAIVLGVVLGWIYAAVWPVGILMAFCFTGFAEHGIWKRGTGR